METWMTEKKAIAIVGLGACLVFGGILAWIGSSDGVVAPKEGIILKTLVVDSFRDHRGGERRRGISTSDKISLTFVEFPNVTFWLKGPHYRYSFESRWNALQSGSEVGIEIAKTDAVILESQSTKKLDVRLWQILTDSGPIVNMYRFNKAKERSGKKYKLGIFLLICALIPIKVILFE